jgi:hypothetical protein
VWKPPAEIAIARLSPTTGAGAATVLNVAPTVPLPSAPWALAPQANAVPFDSSAALK